MIQGEKPLGYQVGHPLDNFQRVVQESQFSLIQPIKLQITYKNKCPTIFKIFSTKLNMCAFKSVKVWLKLNKFQNNSIL